MIPVVAYVYPWDVAGWERILTGLWLSGLRLGESHRLSWDTSEDFSVDLSGKYPRFRIWAEGQKNSRDQLLAMTPDFATWLLQTPESERNGMVFRPTGERGSRLASSHDMGLIISRIGRKANIVVDIETGKCGTAHDLPHVRVHAACERHIAYHRKTVHPLPKLVALGRPPSVAYAYTSNHSPTIKAAVQPR